MRWNCTRCDNLSRGSLTRINAPSRRVANSRTKVRGTKRYLARFRAPSAAVPRPGSAQSLHGYRRRSVPEEGRMASAPRSRFIACDNALLFAATVQVIPPFAAASSQRHSRSVSPLPWTVVRHPERRRLPGRRNREPALPAHVGSHCASIDARGRRCWNETDERRDYVRQPATPRTSVSCPRLVARVYTRSVEIE